MSMEYSKSVLVVGTILADCLRSYHTSIQWLLDLCCSTIVASCSDILTNEENYILLNYTTMKEHNISGVDLCSTNFFVELLSSGKSKVLFERFIIRLLQDNPGQIRHSVKQHIQRGNLNWITYKLNNRGISLSNYTEDEKRQYLWEQAQFTQKVMPCITYRKPTKITRASKPSFIIKG